MCVCAELNARLVQVVGMGSVSKSEPESEAGILMRRGEGRRGGGEEPSGAPLQIFVVFAPHVTPLHLHPSPPTCVPFPMYSVRYPSVLWLAGVASAG